MGRLNHSGCVRRHGMLGTPESFGLRTAAWNAVPTTGKILDGILPLLFE